MAQQILKSVVELFQKGKSCYQIVPVTAIYIDMINYDEEIKKFSPSLEVEETEDAIYNSNIKDITDVVLEMFKEIKDND